MKSFKRQISERRIPFYNFRIKSVNRNETVSVTDDRYEINYKISKNGREERIFHERTGTET